MKNKVKNKCAYFYQSLALKPSARIKELVKTFWISKSVIFSPKNSKKYFGKTNINDWISYCKPKEFSIKPVVTWIGHSSFLVQVGGINILLDPMFYDLMFLYKRNAQPGIDIKDLPPIDFILISHNHGDHFNPKTLLRLRKHNAKTLIPMGLRNWFDVNSFSNVFEREWWQEDEYQINRLEKNIKIKFTFLPAVHWSGRSLFDINKSLWGSWMVQVGDFTLYFAGDSAYASHFNDIAKKFKSIDLALLPIAPEQPRKFVKFSHLDAQDSIKAFIDLKAKNFVPMHWGTFRINIDKFDSPIERLKKGWANQKDLLRNKNLHILKFGQQLEL